MRTAEKRRGPACAVALLPHAALILSLIVYALLGAALFHAIEGTRSNDGTLEIHEGFRKFVHEVVNEARNKSTSANVSEEVLEAVGEKILREFKAVWMQSSDRWHFYGSLFFCCTVFTTVGYGEIYPVTKAGRVACILYATVGIPLMLLVITDVGDILAVLFSNSYRRLHSSCRRLLYQVWNPHQKPRDPVTIRDGTYIFNRDVVVQEVSVDHRIGTAIDSSVIEQKPDHLLKNKNIFNHIIAKEKFRRKRPLTRSCSCPELNQMPPPPVGFKIKDFLSIGHEMERFNVPFLVILLVVFAYILIWALILPIWEDDLGKFDAFYFCFITLTTIGFGDIVPKHPKFFMLTFLFIIMGMAIMSMAFKLGQSRIVSCYRRLIRGISCLSVKKKGKYEL
ncbi:potassium channel subfamily K member 18 [Astyanax mexicanus]|uniref:potassium channel subfamily K member 18 n=1 Tax=Astyanax mexicanus TaxID=7994 RepID=UPI0020CAAAA2|nr:potassium channel subfamily K member 18 [Astyanax mexicanus]